MFGDDFDRVIKKIKEDSWSDGQNQWSSEHDQWANESAAPGQFKSKQEVINHFVKNGKSAAAGASAWERGWRGNTPKAKKPTGPVRNYHDDQDDKRFMSDDAKVARKPLKTFPELAEMLHITGHNLVALISHYPGFPAPAEGVSARYGSRKYYDVDKFKSWVRQHGIHTRLKNKMGEGYTVVPGFNKERYQERPGLEGPFHTKSGKVVYYDKNEGKYYDPDTDMYIEYDDWQAMNEEGVAEGYNDEEHPIRDDGNEGRPGKQRYPGKLPTKNVSEEPGFDTTDSTSPLGGHLNENSDAVYGAIIRRIIGGHRSLISKYGIDAIEEAAREVADWNGDVEEIGTSDVSGWVRQVFQKLSGSVPVNELSNDALARYKTAAGKQSSDLTKAAWAGGPDAKAKMDKGHKRFKGIVKATNKQFANDMKKYKDK